MNQPPTSRRHDDSLKSNSTIKLSEINFINEGIFPERFPIPPLPGGLHPWGDELRRRTPCGAQEQSRHGRGLDRRLDQRWNQPHLGAACHGEFSTDGVMAQGRRVERVAALIRKEVSELIINGIRDERVHQGMVSITEVEVSGDLQHCRIFVSVFGEAQERDHVLEGLQAASGFLRGELGRRLQMRRAPEVVFLLDRGLERGTSVLGLLNRLEDERQQRGDIPPVSDEQPGD